MDSINVIKTAECFLVRPGSGSPIWRRAVVRLPAPVPFPACQMVKSQRRTLVRHDGAADSDGDMGRAIYVPNK